MATDNTIEYAGITLPCRVERFPEIKKAARKFRQYNIPGRNGDVFFQDDAYENVIQSYEVYCGSDTPGAAQSDWTTLAKALYQTGYQVLSDTYDTTHFRKAVFNGPVDVENSWNTHGRATIEFNCRPERFLNNGATPQSFVSADAGIQIWKKSDLSAYLQGASGFKNVDTEYVYAFTLPGGDHPIRFRNFWNDGIEHKVMYISVGTETTASSASSQRGTGSNFNKTGVNPADVLVPASYFDGLPVFTVDGTVFGQAGTITNNYMPAHPDMVLHCVASHGVEVIAARINQYGIYVREYDSENPYIFVDTENWSISKAPSLTGARILANNVRVDAGIQLETGENSIYTSSNYEMTLTPNFWEL